MPAGKPTTSADLTLRSPDQVMRLARLGAFHQCRLSFMRVLLRHVKAHNWQFDRPLWRIQADGEGLATYRARGPERTYTLVCFAHDLPDHLRSDRVIAQAWDATFVLFDGEPTDSDLKRLRGQVPYQEVGRMSGTELVLSRANRSVRLFEHVVERLSTGAQPEESLLESIGYLMRTTAVYGGGKFGLADRAVWANRPEFAGSFQPELLTVWLIRTFSVDLVEHLASLRGAGTATSLEAHTRRRFGVGNSTGLGMAPFLVRHPLLLNNWIRAREEALARVRSIAAPPAHKQERFADLLARVRLNTSHWTTEHALQVRKVRVLAADLERLQEHLDTGALEQPQPWNELIRWAEANLELEAQEQVVSLLIELYPERVDELAVGMSADEEKHFTVNGRMSVAALRGLIEANYAWALATDFSSKKSLARVWYVSAEKLEPRLGERYEEDLEPYEQALAPARDVSALYALIRDHGPRGAWAPERSVAEFLLSHPDCRHAVRRVQLSESAPFAEIRDNTIDADMLPIDMLRCKLSFFGATRFDPRSDRWVRITMYQGAPFPHELADSDPDDMIYPTCPAGPVAA